METKNITIAISDSIGKTSAILVATRAPRCVMVLAHGAGAPMSHPFMKQLADLYAEAQIATLRFNFPYMEKKKKIPDPAPVAEKSVLRVLEHATELFPGLPLVAAGKSFGGRMTSQLLSKQHLDAVSAIVFFGFPLHAPGKPGVERAAHLRDVRVPMLFLQGTNDSLADIELITSVTSGLSNASLVTFPGANHSFKAGKKDFIVDLSRKSIEWLTTNNIA